MEKERSHLDISKEMQGLEATLKDLGVPVEKIGEILGLVDRYQELSTDLHEARKKQFFNDVWVIQNVRGSQKETQISEYLRRFAEHVAQRTCDILVASPDLPLDEIVDRIPPLEAKDPYERD